MKTEKTPPADVPGQPRRVPRVLRVSAGFVLLAVTVPLMLLPVPGIAVPPVLTGLSLLAPDYPWAGALLLRLRAGSDQLQRRWTQLQAARSGASRGAWRWTRRRPKPGSDQP